VGVAVGAGIGVVVDVALMSVGAGAGDEGAAELGVCGDGAGSPRVDASGLQATVRTATVATMEGPRRCIPRL
jgi:hypothetical protein